MKFLTDLPKKIRIVAECLFVIIFVHREKAIFLSIVALDQITKAIVMRSMVPGESIPIIPNIFHLTYVLNPGAAFGILSNQRVFLLATGAGIIFAAAYFYPKLKKADFCLHFGSLAIFSGAFANLIDRVQTGYVVDFFDFRIWPIFNVADIAIVAGMFLALYSIIFRFDDDLNKLEELRQ